MLANNKIIYLIKNNYDIDVKEIKYIEDGSANIYIINEKYVFKYYQSDFDIDRIIKGINISKYLLSLKYNVPVYYKTLKNRYYFKDKNHYAVLMSYILGDKISAFEATRQQIVDSAKFYAQLTHDLKKYSKKLPLYNFNKYANLNIQKNLNYFMNLIRICNRKDIKNDLLSRIEILKNMDLSFINEINKMTICNCHGDYYISQCIYKDDKIISILDFESAKKMPIAIEIIRSYFYMDKRFNLHNFILYVKTFNQFYKLNYYDLKYMPYIYLLKLLSSGFGYEQYIHGNEKKEDYLLLGKKIQKQIIYLNKEATFISKELIKLCNN